MIVNVEFNDREANTLHIESDSYTWNDKWLIVMEKDSMHYFSIDSILHVFVEGTE